MVAVHTTLWHSHPPISNGIVFVWVGVAVSSRVAGDSVVYHFNSAATITIGVKGGDITIRLPFYSSKQKTFWCLWCFGMWVWHDGGLQLRKMHNLPYPYFPFPRPSLFLGMRCHFLLHSTIISPVSTLNLQMLSAFWLQAFYKSVLLCISRNNLWHWIAGPSNDADQITAITFLLQFSSAYVHERAFLFWIGACKYSI